MRFLVISLFILLSAGCAIIEQPADIQQPADILPMPVKPALKSQTYQLEYDSTYASPRVKSVQLPAHKVSKNQTVKIVTDKASVTDTLLSQISDTLSQKQLTVTNEANSDFILTIQQLGLTFIDDSKYVLKQPKKTFNLYSQIANLYPSQQCATISAQVSMRLTHTRSGDVVWFSKSSIDSTSFNRRPLIYSFNETQKITNELEVAAFVHQQNTMDARLARLNKPVSIPEYKTQSTLSNLTKISGACNRTEVSALTPMMQFYLSSILIDKIKVV